MKKLYFILVVASIFFLNCNSEMLSDAQKSMLDPRVPEINVKQGAAGIPNGGSYALDFANGIKLDDTSEPVLFTIENTGTADLELAGIEPSGDFPDEFSVDTSETDLILLPGTNTAFSLAFSPVDTFAKSAVLTITTNDFDEADYSFTVTAQSKPVPDFDARLRTGMLPMSVEFRDKSIPGEEISSWAWDFNEDGIIDSTKQNPEYIFTQAGLYTISLQVTSPGGSDVKFISSYISASTPEENILKVKLNATSIYTIDLNKDGNIDVISAARYDDKISWWENSASGMPGGWIEHEVATFNGAYSVFAADIDGDGNIDILSGAQDSNEIAWFRNAGGIPLSFEVKRTIASGVWYAYSVAAEFINSDGNIDIVSAGPASPNEIAWWENDGTPLDGGWEEHNVDSSDTPVTLRVADLNGDTYLDIINKNSTSLYWFKNNGDETFGVKNTVLTTDSSSYEGYYLSDINNDGHLDIITSLSYISATIVWYENDGAANPSFTSHNITTDYLGTYALYINDINNDGYNDFITTSMNDDVSWWRHNGNNASPAFTKYKISDLIYSPRAVSAADIDNDGKSEIVASAMHNGTDGEILYWDVLHEWDARLWDYEFSKVTYAAAGDLDNDGICEPIAIALGGPGGARRLAWWDQTANGSVVQHDIKTDFIGSSIKTFDFNYDGTIDIMASGNGVIYLFINDGSPEDEIGGNSGLDTDNNSWTETEVGTGTIFDLQDVDNDGYIDIIVTDGGNIYWIENLSGDGSLFDVHDEQYINESYSGLNSIVSADFDRDGDIDVAAAANTDNLLFWCENNGTDTWVEHVIDSSFTGAYSISAADFDNDNNIDIVACAKDNDFPALDNDDQLVWWKNDGTPLDAPSTGNWTKHEILTNINEPQFVYSSDINGDGHVDVLTALKDDNKIIWLKNNGGTDESHQFDKYVNSIWIADTQIIQADFTKARTAIAIDIDFDGDMDVIGVGASQVGGESDGFIMTWENNLVEYGL